MIKEYYDNYEHCIVQDYIISTDEAIEKYSGKYEPNIAEDTIEYLENMK